MANNCTARRDEARGGHLPNPPDPSPTVCHYSTGGTSSQSLPISTFPGVTLSVHRAPSPSAELRLSGWHSVYLPEVVYDEV